MQETVDAKSERIKLSIPIILGYLPVGLACGLLLADAGLTWWQVALMSGLVFGGSAQFVAAALIAQQAGVAEVFILYCYLVPVKPYIVFLLAHT